MADDTKVKVECECDTTEAMYEQEVEAQERMEDRYDDSYEPVAGFGSPR